MPPYEIRRQEQRGEDAGAHYQVTLGPTLSLPSSDLSFGKALLADGATPATGRLVYVRVKDRNSGGRPGLSQVLSALVDGSGFWNVNLGGIRVQDGAAYFTYDAARWRRRCG
ncbi:MAG: hypothetical protein HY681_08110 [Chloroflexi bacterium]|nr:hypothetical protein [Chloroflexota bacterium]